MLPNADRWCLWLAEGLGSGRVPKGPGTAGSVLGVIWFALLLGPGIGWLYVIGTASSAVAAVWICGRSERLLGRHDPGSVVLDEIVAVPFCFAALVTAQSVRTGFPSLLDFLQAWPWWTIPAVFAAFRFFDIAKPWFVRRVQRWPGGLGIVADDLAAAIWVNAASAALVAWIR